MMRFNRGPRNIWIYLLVIVLIFYAISSLGTNERIPEIDSTELIKLIENNEVKSIEQQGNVLTIKDNDDKLYTNYMPNIIAFSFYDDYLKDSVDSGKISYSAKAMPDRTLQRDIGSTILMLAGFAFMWFFMSNLIKGSNSKNMDFGKSRARMHDGETDIKVTFDDVAGLHEEKEELIEIVDFLRNPKKYTELGARIPTGVLMVGPPGTGKTYLSRAVAGEAGVPFFSISGSDFVEMFVGVGASRVRDLFENAKKNAPAIVFIDEIDAVGRRRGAGVGGGHDEREQTLNQLLVEMDGFDVNEGVIIMAATNRADILDPALLRPGRFDRTVTVGLADVRGREAILKVHTRKKPLAEDVNLKTIARRTVGFTPADLENMVNEAALLTARADKKEITMDIISEAEIKVQAGPAKRSAVITERDKRITAFHEAGHALVARLMPNTDPVHLITIVPRGSAGGFTAYVPEKEEQYWTKSQLEEQIVTLLGGRAAEEIVFNDVSTGASNDIERANKLARSMVTTYGMSEKLGTVKYGSEDHEVFMGKDLGSDRGYSESIAFEIDKEVSAIINDSYNKAITLLEENREILDRVTEALIEFETLNGEDFEIIYNGGSLESIDQNIKEEDGISDNRLEK